MNGLYIPFDIEKKYNDYGLSSFSTYIDQTVYCELDMHIKFTDIKKDTEVVVYDNAGYFISTTPVLKRIIC